MGPEIGEVSAGPGTVSAFGAAHQQGCLGKLGGLALAQHSLQLHQQGCLGKLGLAPTQVQSFAHQSMRWTLLVRRRRAL